MIFLIVVCAAVVQPYALSDRRRTNTPSALAAAWPKGRWERLQCVPWPSSTCAGPE